MTESNILPFDYEAVALRGELLPEEKKAMIQAFVETSDIDAVAKILNLPRDLVIASFMDPETVKDAITAKQVIVAMQFTASAYDELMRMIEFAADDEVKIKAIKLLAQLLSLSPDGRSKPKRKKESSPKEKDITNFDTAVRQTDGK